RDPRARRSGRLPPGAFGARGFLPEAGEDRGSPRLLSTGPRPRPAGNGAAIPGGAPGRARRDPGHPEDWEAGSKYVSMAVGSVLFALATSCTADTGVSKRGPPIRLGS